MLATDEDKRATDKNNRATGRTQCVQQEERLGGHSCVTQKENYCPRRVNSFLLVHGNPTRPVQLQLDYLDFNIDWIEIKREKWIL